MYKEIRLLALIEFLIERQRGCSQFADQKVFLLEDDLIVSLKLVCANVDNYNFDRITLSSRFYYFLLG